MTKNMLVTYSAFILNTKREWQTMDIFIQINVCRCVSKSHTFEYIKMMLLRALTVLFKALFNYTISNFKAYIDLLWIFMNKCIKRSTQSKLWWDHQIETYSVLLVLCAGNSPVTGEFPAQRPVTRSFDVFFDLHLNKRLSKQSWGWWFVMPSRSLWSLCNDWLLSIWHVLFFMQCLHYHSDSKADHVVILYIISSHDNTSPNINSRWHGTRYSTKGNLLWYSIHMTGSQFVTGLSVTATLCGQPIDSYCQLETSTST